MVYPCLNARVGRSANIWTGVVDRHKVGNVNDNEILLVSKCAEHRLLNTNTTFRMEDKHKTSWIHPRSKQWHPLDYNNNIMIITFYYRLAEHTGTRQLSNT